jgi:hypothetical protein
MLPFKPRKNTGFHQRNGSFHKKTPQKQLKFFILDFTLPVVVPV